MISYVPSHDQLSLNTTWHPCFKRSKMVSWITSASLYADTIAMGFSHRERFERAHSKTGSCTVTMLGGVSDRWVVYPANVVGSLCFAISATDASTASRLLPDIASGV